MPCRIIRILMPLLSLVLLSSLSAHAISATSCHCFTDRSYSQERPNAADPYFLATTQNSLFALLFKVDKSAVVLKKQGGTSSADLWISYWVAAHTGASPDTLLTAKQNITAWKDVLARLNLDTQSFSPRFATALKTKSSPDHLASIVVDDLFHTRQLLADADVVAIRQAGASNQELIISAVIAVKTGKPVLRIYQEVKNGAQTWGGLLFAAKIDPKKMQREISGILKMTAQ